MKKMNKIDYAIHVKTVFCDIDGCIFKHYGDMSTILHNKWKLLPGVRNIFAEWCKKGYTIVLITGRPESMRDFTHRQIIEAGLFCHHIIMGLPRGQRVVINDMKSGENIPTAASISIKRNEGMENVDI